ncbi:G-protein coupled receptor Mth2 [Elysia marginata]|uniref:G-protein coupled receptor Mth2 n=1 Tax=Elysia marginata TaxID=1093978 RepID=A0AAV4GJN9_9GAST|nr:G-protein coupled receptor Mth2 [Elysia marginata]
MMPSILSCEPQPPTRENLVVASNLTNHTSTSSSQHAKSLYRSSEDLDKTLLWPPLGSTFLSKPRPSKLKKISKRSGVHPPKISTESQSSAGQSPSQQLPVVNSTRPEVLEEPTFVHVIPEVLLRPQTPRPVVVRSLSLLDIAYKDEEEFWFIITESYYEVCPTRCGTSESKLFARHTALCPECWCDTACYIYGDCCPDFYRRYGYTPPLDTAVQACRRVTFPDSRKNYYRMISACVDPNTLANLEHYPKAQNESGSEKEGGDANINKTSPVSYDSSHTTGWRKLEAERQCMNPDLAAHWNQSRPITDAVTGLTFANQYCAQCSGVSLQTSTPWRISVTTTSNKLFSTAASVLDTYRVAMTSDLASVSYWPTVYADDPQNTARACRNYHDVSTLENHRSRCNQTGLWRHYSRAAERACLLLDLPIYPEQKVYSYRNIYCYYCNHDVTWRQVELLRATSPSKVTGVGDNILSVLLDLDGSEERKFSTLDPEVNSVSVRKCNGSQFYDLAKDQCREVLCAPGKFPADNKTCASNPSLQSNVFGYMACYLVSGIPGGMLTISDLASRLAHEPNLVSRFGSNFSSSENENSRLDYEKEISEALKATVVKTSRWKCNSCGLLGQPSNSAVLLLQVAWASQRVLDRNLTEQILAQAQMPLVKLLDITVSASPESAFHIGNISVVKYPYCSIEENPVPNSRFVPRPPPRRHSEQIIAPAPCVNTDIALNQTDCAIDFTPSARSPPYVYTQRGELKNYVNMVQYLPVNSLLMCQYVAVPEEEYSFNLQEWTVRLNHCDSDISASDVIISETDGTMFVCLENYACWTQPERSRSTNEDTIHDILLRWISLICTVLSMLCCLVTFVTYSCLPQLRSSAGINNMILAFLVFFALGLAQFGSSQRDRHDVCMTIGVLTHFFWLAAVAAMSTATFHMFYALSFPLRFQQYHGRESMLLRVYVAIVLLLPALFISCTMLYAQMVEGNFGYASGRNCFVDAGIPKTVFFGVPVLSLVLVNAGMYVFTVSRLHGTPNIGETKIQRNNAVLYSKLSVATGATWIFGFFYDWTDFLGFAYAYMLTVPLLGLFLLLAFVTNKRVLDMARVKFPGLLAKLMLTRGESSSSQSTLKKTRSTSVA